MSTIVTMKFTDGTQHTKPMEYDEYSNAFVSGSWDGKRIDTWTVDGWTVSFPQPKRVVPPNAD